VPIVDESSLRSTKFHRCVVELHLARLTQPMTALEELRGIVVTDQTSFKCCECLRIASHCRRAFSFSASESLAGRIEIIPVGGFSLDEVGASSLKRHWQRGEFPLTFLARTSDDSFAWRQQFIQTFLKGMYLSSVLAFRRPRCFAFGQW
jgi:hypothetical protein